MDDNKGTKRKTFLFGPPLLNKASLAKIKEKRQISLLTERKQCDILIAVDSESLVSNGEVA